MIMKGCRMIVGVLTVKLEIPYSSSLKEKRRVLSRIKDRVRNKFNVSVAEVENHDTWNYGGLGIAVVSNEQKYANQVLSEISRFIESVHGYNVIDINMEFLYV